jgi:hypothetical protein
MPKCNFLAAYILTRTATANTPRVLQPTITRAVPLEISLSDSVVGCVLFVAVGLAVCVGAVVCVGKGVPVAVGSGDAVAVGAVVGVVVWFVVG